MLSVKTLGSNKAKFNAGLPSFAALMAMFNIVAFRIPERNQSILSKFQQFVMMNLAFGVFDQRVQVWSWLVYSLKELEEIYLNTSKTCHSHCLTHVSIFHSKLHPIIA